MRDYKKIDEFLKFWRDIAKENPNTTITDKMVYHELIRLGVNEYDKKVDLTTSNSRPFNNSSVRGVFESWISYYQFNSNINVFNSPSWPYFCQFTSKENIASAKNHIKVYIPLDSGHIEEGAKLIFDFLSRNNIPHRSKIGKHIRFDDIVIRLINPEDAEKLIEFVHSNLYLECGLIEGNPFAFQKDGIALACDGELSYNDTVATLIAHYINTKKNKRELDNIDVRDFYNHIVNVYNNDELIKYIFSVYSDNKLFENYKQVLELIIISADPSFTFEDYIKHYKKHSNYGVNEKEMILKDAIITTANKYDEYQVYFALKKLFSEHSYKAFTDDNHARTKLKALTPNDIYRIITSSVQQMQTVNLDMLCRIYVDKVLQEYNYEKTRR